MHLKETNDMVGSGRIAVYECKDAVTSQASMFGLHTF
jgi:hypothetical protein